jgi:hypothetical protein
LQWSQLFVLLHDLLPLQRETKFSPLGTGQRSKSVVALFRLSLSFLLNAHSALLDVDIASVVSEGCGTSIFRDLGPERELFEYPRVDTIYIYPSVFWTGYEIVNWTLADVFQI